MLETFNHAFSWVCGQNADHTWMPGGLALPCCQRCLGLYVGACVAALLHAVVKPKLTTRFLQVHGLFLLLMVPFGFHWLPQGEWLRAWTGVLFGFGVVTFLWPAPRLRTTRVKSSTLCLPASPYWLGLALTLLAVPALGLWGGRAAAHTLLGLAALGALALAALALANVARCGAPVCSRLWTCGSRKADSKSALHDSAGEMCGKARTCP